MSFRLRTAGPLPRAALLLGCLATIRVAVHGFLDHRPRFGGADASDLCALMFGHYALRGYRGDGMADLLESLQYKPPLWYVGVAALFAPAESLSYGPLLLTNALALVVALWAAWKFAGHLGSARTGLLAVTLLTCLPAVAGRVTILGIEPWHMALLGVSLLLLLRLRDASTGSRQAVLLGGVAGAAMLMKWTFVAGLLGPVLLEAYAAITGGPAARSWRRRLLAATAVCGALFAAWFLPLARVDRLVSGAGSAPSHGALLSTDSLLVFPIWLRDGLSLAGCLLVGLALLGAALGRGWQAPRPEHGCRPVMLLLASGLGIVLVHWLVPHKEPRYLLPAAWSLVMMLAMGLDLLWQRGRLAAGLVSAGCLAVAASSFVLPALDRQPAHTTLDNLHLRLLPDPSDHDLDELVRHPSLQGPETPQVLFSLGGTRSAELLTMINWELYGRNDHPVLSLPSFVPLDGDEAKAWYGAGPWKATHLITNRPMIGSELQLLREHNFARVAAVDMHLPGPARWELWRVQP
jgi:hypothetical protein